MSEAAARLRAGRYDPTASSCRHTGSNDFINCNDGRCACRVDDAAAVLDEIERLTEELSACTESPGGCGYWREAAKWREQERDAAREELKKANARERPAFEAGWYAHGKDPAPDLEQDWQEYRCQDPTDWRAVDESVECPKG